MELFYTPSSNELYEFLYVVVLQNGTPNNRQGFMVR